jgi:hypothetical protein
MYYCVGCGGWVGGWGMKNRRKKRKGGKKEKGIKVPRLFGRNSFEVLNAEHQ